LGFGSIGLDDLIAKRQFQVNKTRASSPYFIRPLVLAIQDRAYSFSSQNIKALYSRDFTLQRGKQYAAIRC
jgi:hypothetical protein